MAIDGQKFQPTTDDSPRMFRNTAEEWAVFNESVDCYSITPLPKKGKDETDAEFMARSVEFFDNNSEFFENNADEIAYWHAQPDDDDLKLLPQTWGNPVSYPVLPVDLPGINANRGGDGQPAKLEQILTGGQTIHSIFIRIRSG